MSVMEHAAWPVTTDNGMQFLLLLRNGLKYDLVRLLLLYSSATLFDRHSAACALLL